MTSRKDSPSRPVDGHRGPGERGRALAVGMAVLVVVWSLAAVPVVSAHTTLERSTPANGAQLTEAPEAVTLHFAGSVESADVTVTDLAGEQVSEGVSLPNETTVIVPLENIGAGVYTVTWQVIGGDGHPVSGSFTFVVSESDAPAETTDGATETAPDPTTTDATTEAIPPESTTETTVTTDRSTESQTTAERPTTAPTTASSTGTAAAGAAPETTGPQTTGGDGPGFGPVVALGTIVLTVALLAGRRWRG